MEKCSHLDLCELSSYTEPHATSKCHEVSRSTMCVYSLQLSLVWLSIRARDNLVKSNINWTLLASHLHGLNSRGWLYFVGFKCTAGGHTITAQPAGIVYPLNFVSLSAFLKIPGTIFASLTVSLITCDGVIPF